MNFYFTKIKTSYPASKVFAIGDDGTILKQPAKPIGSGTAEVLETDLGRLLELLKKFGTNEVLCLGLPKNGHQQFQITTEKKNENGAVPRTRENFKFGKLALLPLDYDEGRFKDTDQFDMAMAKVLPEFNKIERIYRQSNSASVFRDKRRAFSELSFHGYMLVKVAPGKAIEQLQDLKEIVLVRAWLAGHGYLFISKSGSIEKRCLVDLAPWARPEGIMYEGRPSVGKGLTYQPPKTRHIKANKPYLDLSDIPPLSDHERNRYQELTRQEFNRRLPEINEIRDEYSRQMIDKLTADGQVSRGEAEKIVAHAMHSNLSVSWPVILDDGSRILIKDFFEEPEQFDGVSMADPLEPDYGGGKCKARFYWNDGKPIIHSFAHGGRTYKIGNFDDEPTPNIELAKELDEQRAAIQAGYEFDQTSTINDIQFPNEVMSGAAGRFAETYANYIESPTEFMFMSYLTLLGSYGSRLIKMDTVLNTQPRLFTVIVGESADSRKSTAIKKVSQLFKKVTESLFIVNGLGSAEGLQQILKPDDYSGRTPNTLICFDELKSFVDKAGIKNSVLLPAINELFENNTYHNAVKKRIVEINDAHVSLLAASTVATYETIYTPAFINIGFPNRIFLVLGKGKRKYAKPRSMDPADSKRLEDDLKNVMQHIGTGLTLDMDQDAEQRYQQWYMSLDDLDEKTVHAKRLDTYSLRLMMLLAANNLKSSIDLETIQQALKLCDWQLKVRMIYDPIDADNNVAEMEQKIRRQIKPGVKITHRDLALKTNAYRTGIWCFAQAIKNLSSTHEIKCITKKNSKIILGLKC